MKEGNDKKRTVRLTKRQMQAMETKNKIYQAAVREINKKGFNNVNRAASIPILIPRKILFSIRLKRRIKFISGRLKKWREAAFCIWSPILCSYVIQSMKSGARESSRQ